MSIICEIFCVLTPIALAKVFSLVNLGIPKSKLTDSVSLF